MPIQYSLHNEKLIFQYGNAGDTSFVFYKGGFGKNINTAVKTAYATNAYSNGDVDMLGTQRARKSEYEIEATFKNFYSSPYDVNYINRVFNGTRRTVFFYDWTYNPALLDIETDRNFGKVYYNKARTVKPPDQIETQFENMEVIDLESTVVLKLKPFFYDCSEAVEYIDYATYIANLNFWDDNAYNWDNLNDGWDFNAASFGLISSLTNTQRINFFTNLEPTAPTYLMYLRDRFFDRDTTQVARRYILNQTQSSNTNSVYSTTGELSQASADSDIYRIELSQMSSGQSIKLQNLTNISGLTITWIDAVSSANLLVYNSFTKKLYETLTEIEISSSKYRVDIPENSDSALYFSGLLNLFRIGTLAFEQVRLTNSTGTNLDVKIDVLPAYD